MVLDHPILPAVGAFLDDPPGIGVEEAIIITEVEPLGIPLGMIRHQPTMGMYSQGSSTYPIFCTRLRQPACTGFLTPTVPLGA